MLDMIRLYRPHSKLIHPHSKMIHPHSKLVNPHNKLIRFNGIVMLIRSLVKKKIPSSKR